MIKIYSKCINNIRSGILGNKIMYMQINYLYMQQFIINNY